MRPRTLYRSFATVVLASAAVTVSATAASALTIPLPAGTACEFALTIELEPGNSAIRHTFVDENGNTVRTIAAGTGNTLTFTNDDTGGSLTLRSSGTSEDTVYNADGSRTVTASGNNVLILTPDDVTAGPSTRLIQGRYVFTADANNLFTVKSISGKVTDICAALG